MKSPAYEMTLFPCLSARHPRYFCGWAQISGQRFRGFSVWESVPAKQPPTKKTTFFLIQEKPCQATATIYEGLCENNIHNHSKASIKQFTRITNWICYRIAASCKQMQDNANKMPTQRNNSLNLSGNLGGSADLFRPLPCSCGPVLLMFPRPRF